MSLQYTRFMILSPPSTLPKKNYFTTFVIGSHSFSSLISQALVAKLSEGTGVNANNGIISGVLVTVGDLARVVSNLIEFLDFPCIFSFIFLLNSLFVYSKRVFYTRSMHAYVFVTHYCFILFVPFSGRFCNETIYSRTNAINC